MMVVSNTSPLTNLAAIGQFALLEQVCGPVHIAAGVWLELNAPGRTRPGQVEVASATWIQRHRPANHDLVTALRRDLDLGEAESIALAVELKADLVLLDEKEGRHIAQRFGLNVMGVVGILLAAKDKHLILQVRPPLEALRQTAGFYLQDAFYRKILRAAGEEP